jgi:1-acyl-sn-glycerol-3-phosphate acyltransferase
MEDPLRWLVSQPLRTGAHRLRQLALRHRRFAARRLYPEGWPLALRLLQTMASGGAFMAIRAGVPLVPIALIGTYEVLPMHVYSIRPRPLKIVIGEPIPTDSLTTKDAAALTERLFTAITNLYHQHSDTP